MIKMEEIKVKNSYTVNTINSQLTIKNDELVKHHANLTLLTGTVFIVGEVAGGGILSLPHAVMGAGWFGLALIVLCCANAGIAGICLAKSWLILEERYPEYRVGLTRKPFATIGYRAYGTWASVSVSLAMNITRFGTSTVFLLIISDLLKSVVSSLNFHKLMELGVCSWVPIVGITLTPFMWLGSPADFWPAAYTAMVSTVVGSVLLLINIGIESKNNKKTKYSAPTFKSFFLSFGNILFAFGGASAFPNFQNDMKNKEEFPKAVIFGFIGLLLLYIPVSGGGYGVFGDLVAPNIIGNLDQHSVLTTIIEFCFLIHCYFAFLIIINPVLLELEELMNIPKNFNLWRLVFRTIMMAALIFTGLSVPTFGSILDLIGGSTVTLMAFIMPPAFYFKLCSQKREGWPQRQISLYMRLALIQIAIVGLIGGIASTYSSIDSFLDPKSKLEPACYVRRTNLTYFVE